MNSPSFTRTTSRKYLKFQKVALNSGNGTEKFKALATFNLAQVHSWFRRFTYAEMTAKIRETLNLEISVNQLTRYYARFSKAQLFNAVLCTPLTTVAPPEVVL